MLLQLLLFVQQVVAVAAAAASVDWCFCAARPQVEIADVLRNLFAQLNWKIRYDCYERALYSALCIHVAFLNHK